MYVIEQSFIVDMSKEEVEVLVKIIGKTTMTNRVTNFGLTAEQSEIAEDIYIALSDCVGDDND